MPELEEQIKAVAFLRSIAESNRVILQLDREKWEAENKDQIDLVAVTKADVVEAETLLRELTLKAYDETGNKVPAKGVGIREVTKLAYDTAKAFSWASEHKIALRLDVVTFEKICKTASETRPSFVTLSQEPQATISQNLEI